jgi:uncharacterized HAD superfamily protein
VRIAIDIDSTLHHYWDQFAEVAARRFGVDLPYASQTTWRITQMETEQAALCVAETHREEFVAAAVPYEGAVEAVNAWHAHGHFIHITSHRATTAHDATAAWLEAIGLAHDELYCSYDKIARCREIEIDLLIDDSPVNLAGAAAAGIRGATILHPWNESAIAEHGVIAARDWPELARRLKPLLGG